MSSVAIRVDKVSKRYRIGQGNGFTYLALRDVLASTLKAPLKFFSRDGKKSQHTGADYIWALRDICLDIKQGEMVGLIGRNGAGKTTLLKILTRITKPTSGRAEIRGRVGSLLEVGTGFHPELTGRENVFLSGAILGMRKKEIERKFDEIVAFAGIEKFIDTPAKHYSTGMYTRLAFAVAAHLEPEILLVDEVLAVGDLEFQRKCLGKMEKISQGGRTVVFVSHQMNQIRRLCEKVAWIDNGGIRKLGLTPEVVGAYEASMTSVENTEPERPDAPNLRGRFVQWEIAEPEADNRHVLNSLGPVRVRFIVQVNKAVRMGHHGIALFNAGGQLVWGTAVNNLVLQAGIIEFIHQLPGLPLKPGPYRWRVSLYDQDGLVDVWDSVPELLIATEPRTHPSDEWAGLLNVPSEFSVRGYVDPTG